METLFSFKYMRTIVATLGVLLIILVGASALQKIGFSSFEQNYATINVEGVAEVTAVPDLGSFSFSVEAEAVDVVTAQEESGEKINEIMAYLEGEAGVAEKDIKTTGYNTYPKYEWVTSSVCTQGRCDREQKLMGYVVTQMVRVKVRSTDSAGTLIAGVGSRGATNLSGLSFEVDDLEGKKEEARLLAITDAKEKAKRLAKELDVRLGDILSFNDGNSGGYYPMMAESRGMSVDMAFSDSIEEKSFAPEIAVGEDIITAHVTITYEIK
ncbi:MAG: hypothetical protein ACI9VM_000329 [Candidatus Azotimanducaceae bacterium]|jgi:uncharacterized protein YggE